eukprot:365883-Amphidinium_carterae.1
MTAVTYFDVHGNRFTGALTEGGIQSMRAVIDVRFSRNRFTGTLPDGGMRVLRALTIITIAKNIFA